MDTLLEGAQSFITIQNLLVFVAGCVVGVLGTRFLVDRAKPPIEEELSRADQIFLQDEHDLFRELISAEGRIGNVLNILDSVTQNASHAMEDIVEFRKKFEDVRNQNNVPDLIRSAKKKVAKLDADRTDLAAE